MVDNVQKGGVPGGDAVPTRGEGKVENKNIFKKTAQRIGALALICATSMSILVGCGDKVSCCLKVALASSPSNLM